MGAGHVRACLKIRLDAVFGEKAGWRGATKENIPGVSSTEEQRSQTAFSAKTLRAAVLLPVDCVGLAVTARCGDAPASPPCPQPKSPAAAPSPIFRQALMRGRAECGYVTTPPTSNSRIGFEHRMVFS